jgi:hypothetical protein
MTSSPPDQIPRPVRRWRVGVISAAASRLASPKVVDPQSLQ